MDEFLCIFISLGIAAYIENIMENEENIFYFILYIYGLHSGPGTKLGILHIQL